MIRRHRHGRPAALAVSLLLPAAALTTALAGPAGASAAAPAASVPACTGSQLVVGHSGFNGAAGHGGMALEFRNRSGRTCTLHGYPGFDLLTKHDAVVEHARRVREGYTGGVRSHTIPTVRLRPGHYASALVEWADISGSGACRTAPRYAFTPPNTSKTVFRRGPLPVCSLEVHPTVYGRSGSKA